MSEIETFDFVYLTGFPEWEFFSFAPRLIDVLPKIHGYIDVTGVRTEHANAPKLQGINSVHPVKMLQSSRKGRVLIIDFYASLAGCAWVSSLAANASGRVVRWDYIKALDYFNLPHTYLPVSREREYIEENLSKFNDLSSRLTDDRSKAVLNARVKAYLDLDRAELLKHTTPNFLEYFNGSASSESIVVGSDDVYVDIGAADGDTIIKFYEATKGSYRAIHAFEPDRRNFQKLRNLTYIPRLTIANTAIGDENGFVSFGESNADSYGSNLLQTSTGDYAETQVKIEKLDDIVEEATIIKMDVEGFECSVLRGAQKILKNCAPSLAVTCYHYPQDPLEIYDCVMSMHSYSNCKIRQYAGSLYDCSFIFHD